MSIMDQRLPEIMNRSAFLHTHASKHLETAGHAFHHMQAGSGRPVILVHGGGMWLYTFRHVLGPLSCFYAVHALDMPGYGYTLSRDHSGIFNLETMVQALKAYLVGQGIEKASFVGHSWGGGWVLAYALAFPHMVDRIALIDSSGLDVPDVFEWELLKIPVLGSIFMRILTPGMVRRRLMKSFYDTSLVDRAMAMEVYLPLCIPSNRKAQCRISRNLSWKTVEQGLPALTHPTMLIWGDQDSYLDVTLTRRFARKIPGLRVEIIQGCGHSPHEERPRMVVDLLADFLGGPPERLVLSRQGH